MGTGRVFAAALLALGLSAVVSAADRPYISFAEKITVNAGTTQAQFDAYGRRFALNLQSNDRALARLRLKQGAALAGTRLWRGTLEGQPGSWVRLTERGGASEGAIWDGRDLYVVTRYQNVADSLGVPLAARPDETVIFRLSDAANLLPDAYCGNAPSPDGLAPDNALVQYRNMVAELQVRMQGIAPSTMQIEISMIGDSAFASTFFDPIAQMLASYNIVDGIYAEQLGLLILPSEVRTVPAAGDPFTSTVPTTLLAQLSTYRQNNAAVAATGISHLFTGKDLDEEVAGIARLNGACAGSDAVSLSEGWLGTVYSALVMAHELGHNLGADHDGVGACASVPDNYIMSPTINGSEQFSQCSINAISSFIAQASCVTPALYAKVELPQTQLAVSGELEEPLVVPFEVHSTGTLAANDVRLVVQIPTSLFELTATTPGVTCTVATQQLNCDVGSIAAGTTKLVELTFVPSQSGSYSTQATVSASNNQNMRNNRQSGVISVEHNVDVSIAVATSVSAAMFGDVVDVTVTLSSVRSHTARNVRMNVNGGGLVGESFTAPAGVTCTHTSGQTICNVGDLPSGETRTIVVHSRAAQVGTAISGHAFLMADNDGNAGNNNANFSMNVSPVHDVGFEALPFASNVQYNMPYEFRANLRAYGTQPVDGVRVAASLYMQDPAALDGISAVTLGGNPCTRIDSTRYDCVVGTIAAGEALLFSIQGTASRLGEAHVTLTADADVDDNTMNNQLNSHWNVLYGLDISISNFNLQYLIQAREQNGSIIVQSNGIQASSNAVMDFVLPPQIRFTRFLASNASTTSCELVDPQHLRCTYNVPPLSSSQYVSFSAISDEPGTYQASAVVTMAGDENPANNTVQFPIIVHPEIDVGVRVTEDFPQYVVVNREVTVPLEVFTGRNPVAGATLNVFLDWNSVLVSTSVGSGSCTRVNDLAFTCALGDLAANGTVAVSAVVRATGSSGTTGISAYVNAPGENGSSANNISRNLLLAAEADAIVEVGATTATATAGTQVLLPPIRLRRQGEIPYGRFMITIPTGLTFVSMSGPHLVCSGTTTLECALPSYWPENEVLQFNIRVNPTVTGSYVVTARVTALNDFSNGNDEGRIAVTVNAASATPPASPPASGGGSGGGKSGGGGRIEWPVTLLLGLMLLYRQRRRGLHPRRARLRQKASC